jgi:hypothetical protein
MQAELAIELNERKYLAMGIRQCKNRSSNGLTSREKLGELAFRKISMHVGLALTRGVTANSTEQLPTARCIRRSKTYYA